MAVDFVSEVDRKFFSNNMLTNEDWDLTTSDGLDLSDLLGDGKLVAEELVHDLPEELHIPMDEDFPITGFQNDLWYEHSDSSDSGIGGNLITVDSSSPDILVKQEPMSPASSIGSDFSDKSQNSDLYGNSITDSLLSTTPINPVSCLSPSTAYTVLPQQDGCTSTIILTSQNSIKTERSLTDINNIVNSKVKIKPKVPSHLQHTVSTSTMDGEPMRLTAEEFAQLTSKGLLKFNNPDQDVILPQKPQAINCDPSLSSDPIGQLDNDVKQFRRQQRMIKNRESASLSRKRKKEYLSCLEIQLNQFLSENQKLKEENEVLKQKVTVLQSENNELKQKVPLSSAKKICLMAVVLFLSFNAFPWAGILENTNSREVDLFTASHRGRQLLSVPEAGNPLYEDGFKNWPLSTRRSMDIAQAFLKQNTGTISYNGTEFPVHMCPTYFNSTESIKVAEQLAGWMMRHEEQKQQKAKKRPQKQKAGKPVNTLRAAIKGDLDLLKKTEYRSNEMEYQIQLYQGLQPETDFLQNINRRNDTFYVLSFNTDYFLVPASAHNKTMRPRMSLVMPATTLNESMQPPMGSIGMMQIDCEVVGTQLIHVQKSAIPKHAFRKNTTFGSSGKNGEDFRFP